MDDDFEEMLDSPNMRWQKPHFYWNNQIFVPKICYSQDNLDVTSDYNVIAITLDGTACSDLNWEKSVKLAEYYIYRGYKILWELDLGLFGKIDKVLSDQTQFLTLSLSLKHFLDTVWKSYDAHTLGVLVYQGSMDFSKTLNFSEELQSKFISWKEKLKVKENSPLLKSLFCRDVVIEFLKLLMSGMPDELQFFIRLEKESQDSYWKEMMLTHREKLDKIHLLLDNASLPISPDIETDKALCIPHADKLACGNVELDEAINFLMKNKVSFKIIPESLFLTEWEGLDYVIVLGSETSLEGVRKLRGFAAAGGTIVTIGKSLGLPNEISYEEFVSSDNL